MEKDGSMSSLLSPAGVIAHFRGLITSDGYPWELILAHCLKSCLSWRYFCEVHEGKEQASHGTVYNLFAAFFCVAFGGTHIRDWAMGQTPKIFTNSAVTRAFLLAFGMIYYTPYDLVFRMASAPEVFRWQTLPNTIAGAILNTYGAIDSATTLCGSVELGKRLFPDSPQAPFLSAMAAGVGGSFFRYMDRKLGRGWDDEQTELASPTETTKRAVLYTVIYMILRRIHSWRSARLWVTTLHVVYCLFQQARAEMQSPDDLSDKWAVGYPVRPARRNRKKVKVVVPTAKVAVQGAVKTLLQLKQEFKDATGEEYSAARKPTGARNGKAWERVKMQGDIVRHLKKKKEDSLRGSLSGYSV